MAFQFPDPNVTPEFTGANGITYSWDATDGKWVVKGFAAESVIGPCASSANTICDQLTELEEEIDALAPSVERGFWTMNLLGTVANQGQMSLYDDNYSNVGNPTGLFKDAKSIWLNEKDNAGTPHGFSGVEAGEFIELFVQGADEYGLYEVVDVHDETNGAAQWWVIEVNFVRTLEDTSTADNGDIIRVKIFQAPTGGNAGDFVRRAGDDMTGRLSMDQVADLEDFTVPSLQADPSIRFLATKSDDSTSTYSLLYQPGYKIGLVCTSGFWASTLITKTYLYGYEDKTESDGRKTRDTKKAGLAFLRPDTNDTNQDYGSLAWDSNKPRLTWNVNRAEIPRPVGAGVTAVGFQIKGATADNYTSTVLSNNSDLLQVRHRDSESDHIQYFGRITDNNDIVTKEYVDEKFAESGRVLFTPLEFTMDFYSQYPTDNGITGLTSGGNPTSSRDVYGYHIPWLWFEENHPELIGFIFTQDGNLIDGREANLYVRTLNGRPGLEIKDSSRQTRYATVTIQGWHVVVDNIADDQYTHKF